MSENKKPRIAEILRVEVGEAFSIDGYPTDYGMVQVCEDGKIRRRCPKEIREVTQLEVGHKIGSNALYYLLNHPERIIRKPRFTEQEVEILKHMASAGIVSIKRKSIAQISWDAGTMGGVMIVPPRFLPSIQPGQSYTLDEIIGGEE